MGAVTEVYFRLMLAVSRVAFQNWISAWFCFRAAVASSYSCWLTAFSATSSRIRSARSLIAERLASERPRAALALS